MQTANVHPPQRLMKDHPTRVPTAITLKNLQEICRVECYASRTAMVALQATTLPARFCRNLWDSPEPNANECKLSIHLLQFWSPTGFGPRGAGNPIAKQVANIFQNLLERIVKVGLSLRTLGNHTGNLKDSGKSTLKNGNLAACARHTWAILQQTQSQLPLSLAAAST